MWLWRCVDVRFVLAIAAIRVFLSLSLSFLPYFRVASVDRQNRIDVVGVQRMQLPEFYLSSIKFGTLWLFSRNSLENLWIKQLLEPTIFQCMFASC